MDPNETIRRMENALAELSMHSRRAYRDELEELCDALRSWLRSGGFKPSRVQWEGTYERARATLRRGE